MPASAAVYPYPSVSRLMRYWQARYHPKTTIKGKTLRDLQQFINENIGCLSIRLELDGRLIESEIRTELLTANDRSHLIMYDPQFVDECTDTRRIFVDATFAVVPKVKKVTQLLTIMVEKFGRVSLTHSLTVFIILIITNDYLI